MFDIAEWENISAFLFIISGIVVAVFVLNGVRCKSALGYKGWAMRVIKKEENKRAFGLIQYCNCLWALRLRFLVSCYGIIKSLTNYFN